MLRFGRGLDVPLNQRRLKRSSNFMSQYRFAGAGLTLYKKGPFEIDRRIDRNHQIIGRDIAFGAFKSHRRYVSCTAVKLAVNLERCTRTIKGCSMLSPTPQQLLRSP